MTKVMVQGFGWMYIVIVFDWYTKKIWVITLASSVAAPLAGSLRYGSTRSSRMGLMAKGYHLMTDNGASRLGSHSCDHVGGWGQTGLH